MAQAPTLRPISCINRLAQNLPKVRLYPAARVFCSLAPEKPFSAQAINDVSTGESARLSEDDPGRPRLRVHQSRPGSNWDGYLPAQHPTPTCDPLPGWMAFLSCRRLADGLSTGPCASWRILLDGNCPPDVTITYPVAPELRLHDTEPHRRRVNSNRRCGGVRTSISLPQIICEFWPRIAEAPSAVNSAISAIISARIFA